MSPYAEGIELFLRRLADQIFELLEGVDDETLNTWRPSGMGSETNTMMGLATHIAGAGEHWILQNAGGRDVPRDRPAEFAAKGSVAALRQRYDRWLEATHEVLNELDETALEEIFRREANPSQGMSAMEFTRAACVIHGLEHTALHVGHLQIQRQMLDASVES